MGEELAQTLRSAVEREFRNLEGIGEEEAAKPMREGGWTRKEELGHLIDSATNNHARFVRGALEPDYRGPSYDQEGWVALHGYNDVSWEALIGFWRQYNWLLAHLVSRISEERMENQCAVGSSPAVTLRFLIEDYILHMRHHLDHIVGRDKITQYPGAAIGV
jgi:hypothetical protein